MHKGFVTVFIQPGRKGKDADWRHAVGQHRKVGLAGNEVEAGRMDEGDSHGLRKKWKQPQYVRTVSAISIRAIGSEIRKTGAGACR